PRARCLGIHRHKVEKCAHTACRRSRRPTAVREREEPVPRAHESGATTADPPNQRPCVPPDAGPSSFVYLTSSYCISELLYFRTGYLPIVVHFKRGVESPLYVGSARILGPMVRTP